MINRYLRNLDTFIAATAVVAEVKVIRRDIRDTDLEKIALYRYRLKLEDASIVELTERLVEEQGQLSVTKYRFHWQTETGKLIKRWDNAPHHPEIVTFPDHLHDGRENNVISFKRTSGLEVLTSIIKNVKPVKTEK
jgi:hypothetical protein